MIFDVNVKCDYKILFRNQIHTIKITVFFTNPRSTPGSLDLSGSRYKQGQLTPSPPDSPLGSNPDADIRPPSCEEDIDFHRITPPKLPKSNHAPFVTNSNNVARVEPLPPPINTNSKFMGDDLDMLEELKARAKAALIKEGRIKEGIMISSQDTNLSSTNKERKVDQILDLIHISFYQLTTIHFTSPLHQN